MIESLSCRKQSFFHLLLTLGQIFPHTGLACYRLPHTMIQPGKTITPSSLLLTTGITVNHP